MGMNSTATAYNFGQLGSAYSDIAQVIVPPKDMVIVSISFLADCKASSVVFAKIPF